ncbi:hypothetical protein IMZ08_16045 [Bacillus luteolus]|uniref:Membrane protein YkvI n=1 Tax=Litchfieldia luteola TaxID=682179 RepID=A0ABR9QM91_9BACI|nr:hypothetical protein [Cytobacillus luteolus]
MRGKWLSAFQVAAVYVGTVVGAGFATGKEIVEFFTQYGLYGLIGILLSGCLFMWIGAKMMIVSQEIGAKSYKEFNEYLFGNKIGTIVNILMLLVLVGVTSVMLSGAGAVFHEQLGLPYLTGIGITIILTVGVMFFGVKGLFGVNLVVVPIMVLFSLILASKVLMGGEGPVLGAFSSDTSLRWIVSPFIYTAFNLAMAQAVLVPLANEVKDRSIVKWGGIIGGGILCLILITNHISLSSLPNVGQFEIPMAEVMKTLMFSFYWLYVLVIYGEIFTSVIGDVFGLERQIKTAIRLPSILIVTGILTVAFFISLFGYGSLISILYPIFGYMSLTVLFLLVLPESVLDRIPFRNS